MVCAADSFGHDLVPEGEQGEVVRVERQRLLDQPEIGALPTGVILFNR